MRRIVRDAAVAGPVNATLEPIQRTVLEDFGASAMAPAQRFEQSELEHAFAR